jgi:exportin-2 (importin alpha re-exporter)
VKILDFRPYVFQILSQLLEFHTEPGLPQQYLGMLPFFLAPALWESLGTKVESLDG